MIQETFIKWLSSDEMKNYFNETNITFKIESNNENYNGDLQVNFYTGSYIGEVPMISQLGTIIIDSNGHSSRSVLFVGTGEIALSNRTAFLSSLEDFDIFDDFFLTLIGEPLDRVVECHYLDHDISVHWLTGCLIYSEVIEIALSYKMATKLAEKLNQEKGSEFIKFEILSPSGDKAPYAASCDLSERAFYLNDYKYGEIKQEKEAVY